MQVGKQQEDSARRGKRTNFASKDSGFSLAWDDAPTHNDFQLRKIKPLTGKINNHEDEIVTLKEVQSYFQKYGSVKNMPERELDRLQKYYRQNQVKEAPLAQDRAVPFRPKDTAGGIIYQDSTRHEKPKVQRRPQGSQIVFGEYDYFKDDLDERKSAKLQSREPESYEPQRRRK